MVSVIIINYNTWELTKALCENILDLQNDCKREIVVVDNGSNDPAPDYFTNSEKLTLANSGKNKGFAGGINFGVQHCNYEFICVLNSDIILDKSKPFFSTLAEKLQEKKVALVSPKILYEKDKLIQFAGFKRINKFNGRGFAIGFNEKDNGKYDNAIKTFRGHGAAMMFKKRVWQELGGISEKYFLYYEEMDFCEKIIQAGYENWYEPKATAFHIGSYSIEENETPKIYYIFRNRIWYLKENSSFIQQVISMPYLFSIGIIKCLFALLAGDIKKSNFIIKGTLHGLFTN